MTTGSALCSRHSCCHPTSERVHPSELGRPKVWLNVAERILHRTRHRRCRWRSGTVTPACRWTTSGDRTRSSCCSQGRRGWARLPWLMSWPSTAGTAPRLPPHPDSLQVVRGTQPPSAFCGDRRCRKFGAAQVQPGGDQRQRRPLRRGAVRENRRGGGVSGRAQ